MRVCWAQYLFLAVIIALAVLAMLAGCGAKGDLYLPPDEPQGVQQEAAAAHASDETDGNDNQGQ